MMAMTSGSADNSLEAHEDNLLKKTTVEFTLHEGWLYHKIHYQQQQSQATPLLSDSGNYCNNETMNEHRQGNDTTTTIPQYGWIKKWFQIKQGKLIRLSQPCAPVPIQQGGNRDEEWRTVIDSSMTVFMEQQIPSDDFLVLMDSVEEQQPQEQKQQEEGSRSSSVANGGSVNSVISENYLDKNCNSVESSVRKLESERRPKMYGFCIRVSASVSTMSQDRSDNNIDNNNSSTNNGGSDLEDEFYHFCTESELYCREWYAALQIAIQSASNAQYLQDSASLYDMDDTRDDRNSNIVRELTDHVQSNILDLLLAQHTKLQQFRASSCTSFKEMERIIKQEFEEEKKQKRYIAFYDKSHKIELKLIDSILRVLNVACSTIRDEMNRWNINGIDSILASVWKNASTTGEEALMIYLDTVMKKNDKFYSSLMTTQKLHLQYEYILSENIHSLTVHMLNLFYRWNDELVSLCTDRIEIQNHLLFLDSVKPRGSELLRNIKAVILESVKYQTSLLCAQTEFLEEQILAIRRYMSHKLNCPDRDSFLIIHSVLYDTEFIIERCTHQNIEPKWLSDCWEMHISRIMNASSDLYANNTIVQFVRSKLEESRESHVQLSIESIGENSAKMKHAVEKIVEKQNMDIIIANTETQIRNKLNELLHSSSSLYHQKIAKYTKALIRQNYSEHTARKTSKFDLFNVQIFIKSLVDSLMQNELESFFLLENSIELDGKDLYVEIERYMFEQQQLQVIGSGNQSNTGLFKNYSESPMLSPFFFYNLFMDKVKRESKIIDRTFQRYCIQVSHNLITSLLRDQVSSDEKSDDRILLQEFYRDYALSIAILKQLSDHRTINVGNVSSRRSQKLQQSYVLSPTSKLNTITHAARNVMQVITDRNTEKNLRKGLPAPEGISTDEFLPVFICVVCAAELPDMFSELNFIKSFSLEDMMAGEGGFYFSSFESAACFILAFDSEC